MSVEVLGRGAETGNVSVTVSDPFGQEEVMLTVPRSATAREVIQMATSVLSSLPHLQWNLRDEVSSRLMTETQAISEVARGPSPQARVALQPDAGLA